MYRIFIFLFALGFAACDNGTATQTATNNNETTTTAQKAQPTRKGTPFPSIPEDLIKKLGAECDHLDYTFLELPFSLSANEQAAKGSVMNFLRHISTTPAIVLPDCERVAKIYYQTKGEIILEADFYYFKDECKYFVFYEDGKPKYANYLTGGAITYYDQIFNSVRTNTQGK